MQVNFSMLEIPSVLEAKLVFFFAALAALFFGLPISFSRSIRNSFIIVVTRTSGKFLPELDIAICGLLSVEKEHSCVGEQGDCITFQNSLLELPPILNRVSPATSPDAYPFPPFTDTGGL